MPEEDENYNFGLFIDSEFKNLIFQNMNSSFTSEVILKRFVMMRVKDNLFDFIIKDLFKNRIFSSSSFNLFFTNRSEARNVSHLECNFLKNSSTDLYSIGSSLNDFFNSSTCSGLGGSSSTGCQSICSQNSQSSSVTSPVSLYLLNISFFINSINIFPSNFEAALDCNSFGNNICESILIDNDKEVYKFFYDEKRRVEKDEK